MKTTNIKRFVLSAVAASVLSACGGGGGGSSTPSKPIVATIKGKVIDGYVVGADVFLDLNFNGEKDANEPSTTTKGEGDFVLPISEKMNRCSQYVPVVVNVPVGAVDLDDPQNPIDEAYTMVIAPKFAMPTNDELLNATPLTTVIWDEVERSLAGNYSETPTCDSILNDIDLREEIIDEVQSQAHRFAERHNATIEQVFGDYVATGDKVVYDLAVSLVDGLKASYRETRELKTQYPTADVAWIEYYFQEVYDGVDYTYPLYRTQLVQTSNGNLERITHLATTYGQLDVVVELEEKKTIQRDGLNIETNLRASRYDEYSSQFGKHTCTRNEEIKTLGSNLQFGVINEIYDDVVTIDDCRAMVSVGKFGGMIQSKIFVNTADNHSGDDVRGQFDYQGDDADQSMIGISDSITQSDVIGFAGDLDTAFESEEGHGSIWWDRTQNIYKDGEQTMTSHYSTGYWERNVFHADGTHTKYCGTSHDSMVECE
ncbi:Lipoprotein [Vibrio crassostreae]|nr:Lipoprotein [Vibrio crassostreae]